MSGSENTERVLTGDGRITTWGKNPRAAQQEALGWPQAARPGRAPATQGQGGKPEAPQDAGMKASVLSTEKCG